MKPMNHDSARLLEGGQACSPAYGVAWPAIKAVGAIPTMRTSRKKPSL